MGKSIQSAAKLHELSRIVSSARSKTQTQRPKQTQPRSPKNRVATTPPAAATATVTAKKMEEQEEEGEQCRRMPLARVVADCSKRWFQDTLKEAKAGDSAMQVLVAQMYYSGYGVSRDPQKGHNWISKASRSRTSVWRVSDKHPGYRASDSDSCELESKAKTFP